jgi:hypothetical protein
LWISKRDTVLSREIVGRCMMWNVTIVGTLVKGRTFAMRSDGDEAGVETF